jgi:hypothetical protein
MPTVDLGLEPDLFLALQSGYRQAISKWVSFWQTH